MDFFGKRAISCLPIPALQAFRRAYLTRVALHGSQHMGVEARALPQFVRQGEVVYDLGANIGCFTLELARLVGENGHVFSFEPVPQNFKILTSVIAKSGLKHAHPRETAVSDMTGICRMTLPRGLEGFYLAHLGDGIGKHMLVKTETLDDLIGSGVCPPPSFIKCDVEGNEEAVLRGARSVLASTKPKWLMEVRPANAVSVFSLMRANQYRPYIYDGNLIPVSSFRDGVENYFFLPVF